MGSYVIFDLDRLPGPAEHVRGPRPGPLDERRLQENFETL